VCKGTALVRHMVATDRNSEVNVRTTTKWRRGVLALSLAMVPAAPAAAQGWIEPGVSRGGFAVDKIRSEVLVDVRGRVAQVEVSEWFVNRGARLAEGEYLYPLPGEAVFQSFSLFQGDAELRGEIMDADRAREIYEAIVRRRADPALIELAGRGLLRARVFPIEPGDTRKVTLRYTQVLERAGDALQLDYVGGVRGAPPVPVGPRPGFDVSLPQGASGRRALPEAVETRFEVRVEDPSAFLDPFSPTHPLVVERDEELMTVSLDGELRGRLSLFLPLARDGLGMSVVTHRPISEAGYFMVTLTPDPEVGAAQPKDVTVVLDVSGSMSGEKMEQARQALHQLLGSLSGEDRFRLVAFSSAVRVQSRDWVRARGGPLEDARTWVDELVADGGTNIGGALEEAFRLESPRGRLPVVLFLTDGLPSVGEQSPERLADIAAARAGRARVFAFGVGHDVNTMLLDRLSEAGRGDTDYVQPGENVERVLSLLAAKIRHPVLTDLTLAGGPMELREVYPVRIPDLFAGEELVLFGRFSGDGHGQVTVRGERGGREVDHSTELVFPEATDANDYIPRLWASRKLGHLERQVWTEGETASLAEEIRALALRYGLPSRYTSYLVEEPNVVAQGPVAGFGADQSLRLDQVVVTGGASDASANIRGGARPSAPTTGASAVRMAEAARQRRETSSADDLRRAELEALDEMKALQPGAFPTTAIAGRVFRARDGVWTDVAFVEGARLIEIEAFSPAYFDVLRALPEIGPVLREMDVVVIAGDRVALRIGEGGIDEMTSSELDELTAAFRGKSGGE
jgi:Ca-activated chloride channel family protein